MASDLKSRLIQIEVEEMHFRTMKDKLMAESFSKMYTCQSVLESGSEFLKAGKLLPGHEKYLTVTAVLIENNPAEWLQVFVHGFNDSNTASLCVGSLKSLVKLCNIPTFSLDENYVYSSSDFPQVSSRGHAVLKILQKLIKKIIQLEHLDAEDKIRALVNVAYFCVLLISRHCHVNNWTESETSKLAAKCLQALKENLGTATVSDLLVTDLKLTSDLGEEPEHPRSIGRDKTLLGKMIKELKPLLLKSTWQQNPVAAASFFWCVENLKFPHMSDFLAVMLPPSLLFVDDHMMENKVRGVQCLMHIMENTSAEELRWYGRAEVVYEALKHQLYSTEHKVLILTHQALILILKVLVKDGSQISTTTKYDEILLMVMQSAAHENKLMLRRIHTQQIHVYINNLGINVVKYIQKILDLAEEYLEISDPPGERARINILKMLIALLKNAWPRIHCQSYRIIKMLVKLLHQISGGDSLVSGDIRTELITMSVECLELLKAVDNETVTKSLTTLSQLPLAPACVACMNTILSSMQG